MLTISFSQNRKPTYSGNEHFCSVKMNIKQIFLYVNCSEQKCKTNEFLKWTCPPSISGTVLIYLKRELEVGPVNSIEPDVQTGLARYW